MAYLLDHIPEGLPVYPGWTPLSSLTKVKTGDHVFTFRRPQEPQRAFPHYIGASAMACLGLPATNCWVYRAAGPMAERYSPHPVHGEALPLP